MTGLIKYIDTNNSDYKRIFATTAVINIHPHNNVSIDFSEEIFNPVVIIEQSISDDSHVVHSRDSDIAKKRLFLLLQNLIIRNQWIGLIPYRISK
jgi:hypothetical protein